MKHRKSADRARRFCEALAARQSPWWTSIPHRARKLALPYDAVALADECAAAGLVTHDQSQRTKAERRAAEMPHSVTLKEAGRQVARGKTR
jgi:hypothetical protein